jgi:hypothetical protein
MRGDPEALCTHYLRTLFVGMRGEGATAPGGGARASSNLARTRGLVIGASSSCIAASPSPARRGHSIVIMYLLSIDYVYTIDNIYHTILWYGIYYR